VITSAGAGLMAGAMLNADLVTAETAEAVAALSTVSEYAGSEIG
jgi:hypothetical protein